MNFTPIPSLRDLVPTEESVLEARELCKRFDADLARVPHEHALITRYAQSPNRLELYKRGRMALATIADHLEGHPRLGDAVFSRGWTMLLSEIETCVDRRRGAPSDLSDILGWILWATVMGTPPLET